MCTSPPTPHSYNWAAWGTETTPGLLWSTYGGSCELLTSILWKQKQRPTRLKTTCLKSHSPDLELEPPTSGPSKWGLCLLSTSHTSLSPQNKSLQEDLEAVASLVTLLAVSLQTLLFQPAAAAASPLT